MALIRMSIDAWKGTSLGTSISRRDWTYGLCLIAAAISLVWWWAVYIYIPGADARNPPTSNNWGPQGAFALFILLPLGFLRFFAVLFGFGGALMLFNDEDDRLLGILALAAGSHAALWVLVHWVAVGDKSLSDLGTLVSNGGELLFVVVSFWLGLLWFAKGRKQIEAAGVRAYPPVASQSDEVSLSDEYKRRASAAPQTEPPESAPDSDLGVATTQIESSDASSAPDEEAQWQTPVETPAPVAASAEAETSPARSDVRDLSEEDLEKLVAADGTDPGVLYALAGKYRASGLLDRALELYRRTVDLDPSNVQAQNDLGAAFAAGGRRPEAEAAFRHAIALDPYSYNAHLLLARLLSAMNRKEEASQEYLRAGDNARSDDERRAAEAESNA